MRTDSSGSVFPLTDAMGSVIALADTSGALNTTYWYSPYGLTTVAGVVSGNSTQYTGRENDGMGLYYYRARYYSPEIGRFISQDPSGLAAGLNRYEYAGDDPLTFTDPSGREIVSGAVTGAVFGALGAMEDGNGWNVLGGALAGAVAGGFASAALPPGPLTGAAAGAAGDLAGQALGNYFNGKSIGNINWGEVGGSAVGGAVGGGFAKGLGGMAGDAGPSADWAYDMLGGNFGLPGGLLGAEFGKPECSMVARKCRK